MLLHKAVINALSVAIGDADSRYGLSGIHIDADGVAIATDGSVMLYAREPATIPADEYPSKPTPNTAPADAAAKVAGQTVPIAALTQAAKHCRGVQSISALDHVAVTPNDTGIRVVSVDRDWAVNDQHVEPVAGTFPTWDRVLPKGKTTMSVRLSARILADLCKAAKSVGGRDASIVFKFTDEGKATKKGKEATKSGSGTQEAPQYHDGIALELSSVDGHEVLGVVMPMKLD